MISKIDFETFMREAISRSMPNELVLFDIEAANLITQIYDTDGAYQESTSTETPDFKFSLTEVVHVS